MAQSPTRTATPSTMSRQLVDVAPAVADSQPAMADDHKEHAIAPRNPVSVVFNIVGCNLKFSMDVLYSRLTRFWRELLIMILSPLSMKELSRALSLSKQFNQTILDSAEFRRILFLEPKQEREFLKMMEGRDQRCYDDPHDWQPVILRGTFQPPPREIVEPHPILLRGDRTRCDGSVTLRDFNMLNTVPASAFLTQPPLNKIAIKHRGHDTVVRVIGGVTFGAILKATEDIRKVVDDNVVLSPRFAAYQYGRLDELALTISVGESVFKDARSIQIARKALERAKQFAVLDELEGRST